MKKLIYILLAAGYMAGTASVMSAQQNNTRTAYFLDDYTYGYRLNPAFSSGSNFVAIPVLGNISLGAETNVGISNFLYPTSGGKLTLFIDDSISAQDFLGGLKDESKVNANLNLTLLAAGFRTGDLYHTVDVSLKAYENTLLPKSLFSFAKMNTSAGDTAWEIGNIGLGLNAYGEIAYGISASIGESLRVGARAKILMGLAHSDMLIDRLDLSMTEDNWTASTTGSVAVAGPLKFAANGSTLNLSEIEFGGMKGLSGFGLGFDLGASYDFLDYFTASVSLLDLGFMGWKGVTQAHSTGSSSYYFDGFGTISSGEDLSNQLEGFTDELLSLIQFETSGTGSKTSSLSATLNAGVEAKMPFYDRLSFGLLASHRFNGAYSWTEGRLSANVNPVDFIGIAASCGVSNYGGSFGGVVNFVFPGFNFFLGVDSFMCKVSPQFIPVKKLNTNLALGFNITFGQED